MRNVPARVQTVKATVPERVFPQQTRRVTSGSVPDAMKPAEWVKAIRNTLKIKSQEAFAEKLKVGRSAVAKWELGLQKPNMESYKRLLRMAPPDLKRAAPDAQLFESAAMSDPDRRSVPPGLEGFLERYDRRLTDDEKQELRSRGGDFMRPLQKEPDDAYWWALVQLWRKYDPGPSGGTGG